MPAAVAFDLDDTLFREWDYVRSGYRAVAAMIAGATGADAERLAAMMMRHRPLGFEAVVSYIKGMTGAEMFTVDSMIEAYRSHVPVIELRPGARDMLDALSKAGADLLLITDGSTRHQRAKIKALGISDLFEPGAIIISEESGGDKTSIVPWKLAADIYGKPGTRFFYVGDNLKKDFLLPAQNGWTTIMLRDTEGTNVFPQNPCGWPAANLPIITIDNLSELKKIIIPCLQH